VFSPSGECLEIFESKTRALVINRTIFDQHLAEVALNNEAKIHTQEQVQTLQTKNKVFTGINLKDHVVKSKIIVNAEGANPQSLLRKKGVVRERKGAIIGVNIELKGVEIDSNVVEVWFNQKLATNFFCWVIPTGENSARIGLASTGTEVLQNLKQFISNRFKGTNHKILNSKPRVGYVLTGGPIKRTFYDGLLIVGDAAGQVKPTTGGGVILGGLCALKAGITSVEALETSKYSSEILSRYQKRWTNEIGDEMRTMLLARNLLNMVNDQEMDKIFQAIKSENLEPLIQELVENGDMDFQAEFIKKSLKNPELTKLGLKIIGSMTLNPLTKIVNL
jgi:flavin-dependent dehydrogenase